MTEQTGLEQSTKVFFVLFFLAMSVSIGLTYYHTIVHEDYAVFTNPDTVPSPTDFFADLVAIVTPYISQQL